MKSIQSGLLGLTKALLHLDESANKLKTVETKLLAVLDLTPTETKSVFLPVNQEYHDLICDFFRIFQRTIVTLCDVAGIIHAKRIRGIESLRRLDFPEGNSDRNWIEEQLNGRLRDLSQLAGRIEHGFFSDSKFSAERDETGRWQIDAPEIGTQVVCSDRILEASKYLANLSEDVLAVCTEARGKGTFKLIALPEGIRNLNENRKYFLEREGKTFWNHLAEQAKWERKFGKAKPIISAELQGQKFVAVGSQLIPTSAQKFSEFLASFLADTFGKAWFDEQYKHPVDEQHPVARWRAEAVEHGKAAKASGLREASGAVNAFLLLGFDLYLLRHHHRVQKSFIERLKHVDQFQGARHELFAAATCIRAGFLLTFENEHDGTKKHPEFIAVFPPTGESLAVEAKSCHRKLVLNFSGGRVPNSGPNLGILGPINRATAKAGSIPFVIFLDLNMPPIPDEAAFKDFVNALRKDLSHFPVPTPAQPDKFNLIIFTNNPDHYISTSKTGWRRDSVCVYPRFTAIPMKNALALQFLADAVGKYGLIPEFPPKD